MSSTETSMIFSSFWRKPIKSRKGSKVERESLWPTINNFRWKWQNKSVKYLVFLHSRGTKLSLIVVTFTPNRRMQEIPNDRKILLPLDRTNVLIPNDCHCDN
jgi:hypothetical protein